MGFHRAAANGLYAAFALAAGCGLVLDELGDFANEDASQGGLRDGAAPRADSSTVDGGALPGPDAALDGAATMDAGGCTWGFDSPVRLAAVSYGGEDDWAPSVSPDRLTLYFDTFMGGGNDLYTSMRPDTATEFSVRDRLDALNSSCADAQPRVTDDGLELFFISARPVRGGCTTADLFVATRSSLAERFGAPTRLVEPSDEGAWEEGPFPSTDGRRLYFGSNRAGGMDVFVTERPAGDAPFGPARAIDELNTGSSDRMPTLSADELVIVFSSNRPGGLGGYDLWMARRPDRTTAFGAPMPVPDLNTAEDELFPYLTRDGAYLYLNWSTRLSGGSDAELYRAARTCR